MKKVAVIYQGAKFYGGIETYLEQLFLNLDKQKIELTLISLGNWELTQKLQEKREKIIIILPFHWYNPLKIQELAKILEQEDFDLTVSQGLVANFVARLASYLAKIPNLVTIHSDYNYDFHGSKRTLYWLTFKLLEPLTSKYLVVSKYLKNATEQLGVKSEKITVVYNGVKEISPKTKKMSKEIIIGSLGRLHFKKGYHNLIQAMSLLSDEKVKLYIWGDGEEKSHLDALIKHNHLVEKVSLKGFTKNISEALGQVDLYIQPSLEEGFGITVVEAMYAAKPIIVTPAGSLPELITDGKTGLICKSTQPAAIAATLKAALGDRKLALAMGQAARNEALTRFSIDKWIRETEKVYLEAAK